ncbi:MAG: hypothetical protein WC155_03765 [Candidatus Cloacimonadales bacterium]
MKKLILICLFILSLFAYANSQELCLGKPVITWEEIGKDTYIILSDDMVIVKRFDSNEPEDEHFQWWHIKQATIYSAEKTTYFQYEEEADYTAIFVEIDSTLGIKEVAIYADDECKGARLLKMTW